MVLIYVLYTSYCYVPESFVLLLPNYNKRALNHMQGSDSETDEQAGTDTEQTHPDTQDSGIYTEPHRGSVYYAFGCVLSIVAACMRAFSMAGSQVL